jgi:menaquinol-cytochrome c reductase iron-sulfur subunit
MALPALMYLLLPPRLRGQGEWVEVGDISQLPAGAPVKMTFRRMRVDGWKVLTEDNTAWVVRSSNLHVFAFGPQCTHLGCAYHWDRTKDEFFCPCHNSLFAIDGKVIGGPARQPLHRYETRVEGNRLFVGRLTMSA